MRLKPQTYAFTTVTHDRKSIFQVTTTAQLMVDTLMRHRDMGRFLIHGFVVMPDHIHVMLTPNESIEKTAQWIKGGFSHAIRQRLPGTVWQAAYHAHRVTSAEDYAAQLGYIAQNPIRKGWMEYPYVHTRGTWQMDISPEYPGG